MRPASSLIITTYNWPAALDLSLASIQKQTILPDEIIIADDGSTNDTRLIIDQHKKNSKTPIHHVWHRDEGFRVGQIRNKALCQAKNAYIIQIDGDMILHSHFVEDHLRIAKPNNFFVGSRVLISPSLTQQLQAYGFRQLGFFSKGIKNRINTLYFPALTPLFYQPTLDTTGIIHEIRGCNMSYWKKDMIAINGYNEEFIGWGREDSEVGIRLVNSGIAKNRIKFSAIQFHQYHKIRSRARLEKNDVIMHQTIQEKLTYCSKGLADHCT